MMTSVTPSPESRSSASRGARPESAGHLLRTPYAPMSTLTSSRSADRPARSGAQRAEVGQRLGAHDHALGSGLEEPGRGLRVADPRVHPGLRPELLAQFTDDIDMVAGAGDGVEVGDVQGPAAALTAQRPGDGQGAAAVGEATAHGAVVLPVTAQTLHHPTPHEV